MWRLPFLCFSPALVAFAQDNILYSPVPDNLKAYVLMVPAGAPEYGQVMNSLVKGYGKDLAPIVPFSVLIKNQSQQPLLMTTVMYEVEDQEGVVRSHSLTTIDLAPSGASLRPQQCRFVSIVAPANQMLNGGHPENLAAINASPTPLSKVAASLQGRRRIAVSVDSIITADGTFIGQDKANALHRIQEERRAEMDISMRLSPLLKAMALDDIKKQLDVWSTRPIAPSQTPIDRDFYNMRLVRSANQMSSLFQQGGLDRISTMLAQWDKQVSVHK
jgi:hypothetical protein